MADFGSALWNKPAAAADPADPVTRSLRFDGNSRLFRSTGSTSTTWTLAFWFKRSLISGPSDNQYLACWAIVGTSSGEGISLRGTNDSSYLDKLSLYDGSGHTKTTRVFRDPSGWAHLCISVNSGTATVYYNGESIISGVSGIQALGDMRLAEWINDSHEFYGYMADVYGIEGSALDHESFTESNDYGGLKPIAYTGSFGTNGFHIDAQPLGSDADLLVSSIDRNDGDTLFADVAKGHTITRYGHTHHDTTAGNPFGSGTAIYFDGTGDYLDMPDSTDFTLGSGDFTYEFWVNFGSIPSSGDMSVLGQANSSGADTSTAIGFKYTNTAGGAGWAFYDTANSISYHPNWSGTTGSQRASGATSVSANTWYHFAIVRSGDTVDMYKDGVSYSSITLASSSASLVDSSNKMTLGRFGEYDGQYLQGYLYDVRLSKGTARYTSDFSSDLPSAPFELNPVYLGGDQSGNKNHFEPTNISSHDVMLDVPYPKNYATLNPLQKAGTEGDDPTEGNLSLTGGNNPSKAFSSTIAVNSGKYYAEFYLESLGYPTVSVSDTSLWVDNYGSGRVEGNGSITYDVRAATGSGDYFINATSGSGALSLTPYAGDIIQVAFDADTRKVWFGKNGTWNGSGDPENGTNHVGVVGGTDALTIVLRSESETTIANFGQDPTFAGEASSRSDSPDTSQGEFYFAPPNDSDGNPFKSLNSSNLDAPAVTPADHFNTVLYTGTRDNSNSLGATSNAVTGMGFEPSLLWIKDRDNQSSSWGNGYHGNYLFDSVQGTGKAINIDGNMYTGSNDFASGGFLDGYDGVSSFDSDGFTLDESEAVNYAVDSDYNGSIDTYERYVAWGWKLGSTGSSSTWASGNTDPTTEKYNASAGVSVIRHTETSGSGSGVTLNHSLGAAPEFAFLYNGEGGIINILSWHKDLDANKYLKLSGATIQTTGSGYFPSGCATANTFEIGSTIAGDSGGGYEGWWDIHLYLFTSVEGMVKVGSWVGNGDDDGPMVYCGFRPSLILAKAADRSNSSWYMWDDQRDGYNVTNAGLWADLRSAESNSSSNKVDILSNGFKLRGSGNGTNSSSNNNYIFIAWAHSPFSKANSY